jgi:phage baseplate assembly protein W
MSGIAVKLPVALSDTVGVATTKTVVETLRQNLKTLILTNPGERVMEPGFGVGLEKFLFERFTESTYASIQEELVNQVRTYMPQIAIKNFEVSTDGVDNSELRILIEYVITPLGTTDILDLPISNSSISPVSTSGVSVSSNSSISGGPIY